MIRGLTWTGLWVATLLLWPLDLARGENLIRTTLNVGFSPSSFLDVNQADAKAAFRLFTETVGKDKGYELDVVVHIYDTDEELAAAATRNELHLVIMKAWTFLNEGLEAYLEPRFLAIESGYGPREYLLLVSGDSLYRSVADLRGRHVVLLESTNCEMARPWLRSLLAEEGLGEEHAFFDRVDIESKPTKVVLPVFFGKSDACVVNRPVFETLRELNPQLGQKLRVIAVSEPLVDSATFLSLDGWETPQQRADMIDSLKGLHESAPGKQILMLFRVGRLAPFEDRFMEGTQALRAKYDRLLAGRSRP